MTTVTFDTYLVAEKLQKRGFIKEQTDGLMEAVRDYDVTRLVTADSLDIRLRETELKLENRLKDLQIRIGGMIMALGGILIAIKYFG